MNTRRNHHRLMNQEGAAGATGGAPPAAPPAAAPAPPAPPASSPPAAPPAALGVPWLQGVPDTDLIAHAQNKGWQTAVDAVKSHRELEKMLGADRAGRTVTVPTDEADANAWGAIYDKLGRPATADGYKLPVPDGHAPAFARAAEAEMHKLGVSAKQGQALAAWWNAQAAGQAEAQAAAEQVALAAEHESLKKDWGAEHDMRREVARRAAVALGLDEQAMDALEKVTGYSKVLKALAKTGDLMREHGAEGMVGGAIGSFAMTPEGAKARKSQLMADKDWSKKAMVNTSAEWAELKRLDGVIAGGA